MSPSIRNRFLRGALVAAAATTTLLTVPGTQAQAAPAGWESRHWSHYRYYDGPHDEGGTGAISRWASSATGQVHYGAEFSPYGERLHVTDNHTDGRRAEAEVKVYKHADADGIPYDLVDHDTNLLTGTNRWFNLGTPDGSGDIKEGYYVAIRVRPEGTSYWSHWAYARA